MLRQTACPANLNNGPPQPYLLDSLPAFLAAQLLKLPWRQSLMLY